MNFVKNPHEKSDKELYITTIYNYITIYNNYNKEHQVQRIEKIGVKTH